MHRRSPFRGHAPDPPAPERREAPGAATGARRAVPLAVETVAAGLAFGAVARATGLSATEAVAMSGLVFAGTAQLAALGLWSAGGALPALGILLTTLVVNARLLLLGLALGPWLAGTPRRRAYGVALLLSDETWALTAAERARESRGDRGLADGGQGRAGAAFMAGSGVLLWLTWVGGSAAGFAAGSAVRDPARWALDFAGVAAILVLLAALWRGRGDAAAWTAAAAVALTAARLLPGQWYIVLGALAGSAAGAALAGGAAGREAGRAADAA